MSKRIGRRVSYLLIRSAPRSETKAEELKDVGPAVGPEEEDGSGSNGAEVSPIATYDDMSNKWARNFVIG